MVKTSIKITKYIDNAIKYRYFIVAILFLLTLLFLINGFSLDIWNNYIVSEKGSNILFGKARQITSDTWALALPAIFSQIENGFPVYNYDIMTNGANALLMGLPVWDISMIGRPFMWGYLLFGKEVGMSWYYFLRLFMLLLTSYEICNYFSNGKKRIAFLFSIVITCSPAIQWWFGQTIIDTIIFFQLCVVGILYYLSNIDHLLKKILSAILLLIGGTGFILVLYPPLQVPLGYLFIILMICILLENKMFKKITWKDVLIGLSVILSIGLVIVHFKSLTSIDMEKMLATVYPGTRVQTGGEYNLQGIFYYFTQWLLPMKNAKFSNNCEMSAFVPFFPMILFVFPYIIYKRPKPLYILIFVYEIFLISWLFIGFPAWFGKYTMFSYVTENRLTLVIGLISIYLAIIVLKELMEIHFFKIKHSLFITLISGGIVSIVYLTLDGGNYLDIPKVLQVGIIIVSVLFIVLFTYLFLRGYVWGMAVLLSVFIGWSGMTINPIAIGSGSLTKSNLAINIQKIEKVDPNQLWIFNEEFPYSNYLLSQGVRGFNVLNPYEDYEKWIKLDPIRQYEEVYNRYAHVGVEIVDSPTEIKLAAPDAIKVNLNYKDIVKLGAKYVVSKKDINEYNYKKIYTDSESGFSIYLINQ